MVKKSDANDTKIYQFYKERYYEHKKQFDKLIILIQCGDFYEVYDKKNSDGEYELGPIEDYSRFTNYRIKMKKDGTYMSGCPISVDLDDLKEKCHAEHYVVIIYEQEETKVNKKRVIKRVLAEISTPGTSISFNDMYTQNKKTNNLMIAWLYFCKATTKKIPTLVCGLSNIDMVSGDCNIHEYTVRNYKFKKLHNYDDIETFYSIYNPSEVIFVHNFEDDKEINEIKKCCGMSCLTRIHNLKTDEKCKKLHNDKKNVYKMTILKKFYNITDYFNFLDIYELDQSEIALKALVYNLDIIMTYNPKIITTIKQPIFKDVNTYIKLRNSVLKQLNIINCSESNHHNKTFNSLVNLVNKCKTPMGKRRLNNMLLMPVKDGKYLRKEYNMIQYFIDNLTTYKPLQDNFKKMKDIEYISRKANSNKFSPYDFYVLYKTIVECKKMFGKLKNDMTIAEYFKDKKHLLCIESDITNTLLGLRKYVKFDIINEYSDADIYSHNFFIEKEMTKKVFDLAKSRLKMHEKLNKELQILSKYIDVQMIKENKKVDKHDNIKVYKTEKTPAFLKMTVTKSKYLKNYLKESKLITDANYSVSNKGKSGYIVESEMLTRLHAQIFNCENKFSKLVKETFKEVIEEFKKISGVLHNISEYVSIIDNLLTKAIISKKYNYCKPEIYNKDDDDQTKSFIDVKGLRHPLVEHLLEDETFTTNDICIGKDNKDTRLIYGINAVGKSVLMKSIGMCVFMAQVGMFVPAKEMQFKPYTQIFTRIIGNDNMFKAQSTFTVEMTELCTIINNADEDSLILGDELCSGTERQSAILLFLNSLVHISEMKSSCVFTTHIHVLRQYLEDYFSKETYNNITFNHMSVRFDKENDCIKYDRKLKEGTGPKYYGLEVCKGIGFNNEFLDNCFSLKQKIFGEGSILDLEKSKYNNGVLKNQMCEICHERRAEEIHHLDPQKNANEDGFMNNKGYHKHHKGNLINICKKCHLDITLNDTIYKKTKTTKGEILEKQDVPY